jgi:crotonyl-CoA carboxylase/reductase
MDIENISSAGTPKGSAEELRMRLPPLGHVPRTMRAALIRSDRFGKPSDAFRIEEIPVPKIAGDQVLVAVIAAGVNYNGIWASAGTPVDVIALRRKVGAAEDYHVAGSDGAGIVWAVGPDVRNLKIGTAVVISCGQWDDAAQGEPQAVGSKFSSPIIWGYESNYGSFAEFTVVHEYQCHPKPDKLTWEEAACFLLTGATAYRQLFGWPPHTVRPGDPVLIWGGAGGLGSVAIQLVLNAGGIPIAVVSNQERSVHCRRLGASVIDRSEFHHLGPLPEVGNEVAFEVWTNEVRRFGRSIWSAIGERRSPRIVLEHSGMSTLPTSLYVCDSGGMVVTCGATSGHFANLDLRFLWMRQKRLQGSHFADLHECRSVVQMAATGAITPCLSRTFEFEEIAQAHQLMYENRQPPGSMAVLVNASRAHLDTSGSI